MLVPIQTPSNARFMTHVGHLHPSASKVTLVIPRNNDLVDLQQHPAQLGRKKQLRPLGNQRLNHKVLPHVVRPGLHTVHSQS